MLGRRSGNGGGRWLAANDKLVQELLEPEVRGDEGADGGLQAVKSPCGRKDVAGQIGGKLSFSGNGTQDHGDLCGEEDARGKSVGRARPH